MRTSRLLVAVAKGTRGSPLRNLQRGISTYDANQTKYQAINKDSPVSAWNEWDPLEEVIVGTMENATIPALSPEVKSCAPQKQWDFFRYNAGKYWADIVPGDHWKKAMEEINGLVKFLENEGIKVRRPEPMNFSTKYKTPDFESTGMYCAMPRDFLMVVGDELIEATMTWRSRFYEYRAYRSLIKDYFSKGAKWTAAPKPTCSDQLIDQSFDIESEAHRSELQEKHGKFATTEFEPCFDAADFMRAGRDIFAQRSQVTNQSGIEWMRRHLAPRGIRVHTLTFQDPRPMHIDSTLTIMKPGYIMENVIRPCNEIDIFKKAGWKVVSSPHPMLSDDHPFFLASKWLSMNTLIINPDTVLIEKGETDMHEAYKKIGMKVVPMPFKHAYSFGGGFHCYTCDIRRNGKLESYFD